MIWKEKEVSGDEIKEYSSRWKTSNTLTKLLLNRGIYLEKDKFLNASYDDFLDPFLFEEMECVVDKIIKVKDEGKTIYIYGDYDVDGITSTAFLVLTLRKVGIKTKYFIPNRMGENYGLDKNTLDYIKENNGELVITVDTGVNSLEDVSYGKSIGIDVIVTDHHKAVKEADDEKLTIINPKFSQRYPFKYLAGAGVALKVAQGVYKKLKVPLSELNEYMDIAMIGTVADVVPLIDENRIIVKKGLEALKKTKVKGLKYLKKYVRIQDKDITTTDISFFISPLLNSLGRVGRSKVAADFFIERDEFKIYNMIEDMKRLNKQRREIEQGILNEVKEIIAKKKNFKYIFLKSNKWHPGVIGVIASKVAIKYNIPAILVSIKDGFGKASCRSVKGINIFDRLKEIEPLLKRYGGHDLAAGFVAKEENLDEIEKALAKTFDIERVKEDMKVLEIDGSYSVEDIDDNFLKELRMVSPYGLGNKYPLFKDKGIRFSEIKTFGLENRHFKGILEKNGVKFQMVAFDLSRYIDQKNYLNKSYEIVYYPEKVYYKGVGKLQIRIKDIKISE